MPVDVKTSVIISTYNQPLWLEKVLVGYMQQTVNQFEIIIADDGSKSDTTNVINKFKETSQLHIVHVFHEDDGFRKNTILNKAILASKGSYLIFTDGDCIPRNDFVSTHLSLKRENCFLSGGYFKLPLEISEKVSKDDIVKQLCFDKDWLISNGLKSSFKLNKLTSKGIKEMLLNNFTTTKATWDGMNASGYKKDIVAVNGFDERMGYGGEDREMGERLINNGTIPKQIRYSAICVHLEHSRFYKTSDLSNKQIRKETRRLKKTWTEYGIVKSKD